MFDVTITKHIDGGFIHYRMTPSVVEYLSDQMHIATSTMSDDKTFVSFANVFHDMPFMPGAWFLEPEEADLAVERWAEIVLMMSHYKTLTKYVKDLEPPF